MATRDQQLIPRPGGVRLAAVAGRVVSVVGIVLGAVVGGTWSTAVAAQDHAPSTHKAVPAAAKSDPHKAEPKKAEPHAAEAKKPSTQGHGTASHAATPPTGRGKSEPRTAAESTVHADDDVEHAAEHVAAPQPAKAAAQPARSKELDAVMQRINRRISGGTGTASAAAAPQRDAHSGDTHAGAAASTAARSVPAPRPRGRTQPPAPATAMSRVRLHWRPTIVWPAAVLGDADRHVDVAWVPEVH